MNTNAKLKLGLATLMAAMISAPLAFAQGEEAEGPMGGMMQGEGMMGGDMAGMTGMMQMMQQMGPMMEACTEMMQAMADPMELTPEVPEVLDDQG